MRARFFSVRSVLWLILMFSVPGASHGQAAKAPAAGGDLVTRALAAEARNARDVRHPMRYKLRKSSPRLTSTKEIYETRDGEVANLVAINDSPLSQTDEQTEQTRLDALLQDPSRQRHRKEAQDQDAERAMKVLRALPNAFLYQFAGSVEAPTGKVEKFAFRPNPKFDPPDLEAQALTAMTGEIWIDAAQERVARLEGHLQHDVDFGWGILGRLNKGGWIVIEQTDVGNRQWRIVHFKMEMNGRVLFKNKSFDTTEDETQFAPLAVGLRYQDAIQMMRAGLVSAKRDPK